MGTLSKRNPPYSFVSNPLEWITTQTFYSRASGRLRIAEDSEVQIGTAKIVRTLQFASLIHIVAVLNIIAFLLLVVRP